MYHAHVRVNPTSASSEISPLLFGHFIEFIRDGISAMWAEMLQNRSFEQQGARPHLAASWEVLAGDVARVSSSVPSPTSLRLAPRPDQPAAVAQSPLCVDAGQAYHGSAWLCAPAPGQSLVVSLTTPDGATLDSAVLRTTEHPARVGFTLRPTAACEQARFVLSTSGSTPVHVDQVSLMPGDNEQGWRHDVLELIRALRPAFIRFPGGCFADVYRWRDGVGDRDLRPTTFNHAWKHVWQPLEGNEVGTAEFVQLCRLVGCEPLIVVNFGSADPEEAAAWVEYCNGDTSTPMGRLRAAHGYPEPFGVRLWEIGNETWGGWEVGHCDAAAAARRYRAFRDAMRAVDPDLVLLATGSNATETNRSWDRTMASALGADMDYLTLHYYAPQLRPEEANLPEAVIYEGTAAAALKLEESIAGAAGALADAGAARVRLAITEWNTMYTDESWRETTLGAAVCNATFLNLFLRRAAQVGMTAFSDLVAGWEGGLIRSGPAGAFGTPTYWVYTLYAQTQGRRHLPLVVESPAYAAPGLGHLPPAPDVPLLDAAATESADGTVRWFFLVNRSLNHPLVVTVDPGMPVERAEISLVTGPSIDAANTLAEPERVVPESRQLPAGAGAIQLSLPPHSVMRLAVQKGAAANG